MQILLPIQILMEDKDNFFINETLIEGHPHVIMGISRPQETIGEKVPVNGIIFPSQGLPQIIKELEKIRKKAGIVEFPSNENKGTQNE